MRLTGKFSALLKNAGNKWFNRRPEKAISRRAAKKIQKTAYEDSLNLCFADDSFTPVYLEVARQLNDKNEQIVRAAVSVLYKTAVNTTAEDREKILKILRHKAENMSSGQLLVYLQNKISALEKI